VHVTLRALRTAGYLRGWRLFKAITAAIRESQERFGLRVVLLGAGQPPASAGRS
jgi:hypothetical protein